MTRPLSKMVSMTSARLLELGPPAVVIATLPSLPPVPGAPRAGGVTVRLTDYPKRSKVNRPTIARDWKIRCGHPPLNDPTGRAAPGAGHQHCVSASFRGPGVVP